MTYLTPEERRRTHGLRLAASQPRSRARVAVRQDGLAQAVWTRTAMTTALFAVALGGALALREYLPALVEWILPRAY